MRRTLLILSGILITASLSAALPSSAKAKDEVRMSTSALRDKIHGAWAGQVIGCTYGGPTEFKYTIMHKDMPIPWSEHEIKKWYDHSPGLYDDVYMDLTFVEVFEKEGLDAPIESFANAFAYAKYPLWHANKQGRFNIMHGLMPPASGHWENNPHADDIDFQIEADYAGIMAPGMPNSASHYADGIGHMMNYGDGWYGGVYVAAMYTQAFICDDIEKIAVEALKTIPQQSKYYKCMSDVIRWHKQYPEAWELTWAMVNKEYGWDIGCPDGVYNTFNIDAVLNSAYILIGLLYGEKNFGKTIDIATRCGSDSDCNPSSAAGILGTIIGFSGIPEYWKKPIYEVEDRNFAYTDISVNKATQYSFNQALKVIERGGGKVGEDEVTIKLQKPQAVRFEQSFAGHYPKNKYSLGRSIYLVDKIDFEGNGIVVKYHFYKDKNYKEHGYEAQVAVYLDGELSAVVSNPSSGMGASAELYYKYNLPEGPHTLTFNFLNKEDGITIVLDNYLVYTGKEK